MHSITFADVVLILSFADASALSVADAFLAHLESNAVETIPAPKARCASLADVELHDHMVDNDPLFLEWDSVERQRRGQAWACFASGVDTIPGEVQ